MNSIDTPITIVSLPQWRSDYLKSTVELAKELGRRRKVLFVDYNYTWLDWLKNPFAPRMRMLKRSKSLFKPYDDRELYVLSLPPNFPSNFLKGPLYNLASWINGQINSIRIKWARKALSINKSVWICAFHPVSGSFLQKKWSSETWHYYSYDNIHAALWARKHGPTFEKRFLQNIKSVIVTSDKLRDNYSWFSGDIKVVNNGVNIESITIKNSFKNKKTIGYLGSVDDRIEGNIIAGLAEQLPDYKILIAGREKANTWSSEIKKYGNVEFTGSIDPANINQILQEFDLGIIPFVLNNFTSTIYPMKVNEYLAAGLPVVSTPFADLTMFHPHVSVTSSAEEFVLYCQNYINNDNVQLRKSRRMMSENNSWSNRAKQLLNIL